MAGYRRTQTATDPRHVVPRCPKGQMDGLTPGRVTGKVPPSTHMALQSGAVMAAR